MSITLYHNNRCSKSRETLALLESRGIQPRIVAYLETPPDAATLKSLLQKIGKLLACLQSRGFLRVCQIIVKDLLE